MLNSTAFLLLLLTTSYASLAVAVPAAYPSESDSLSPPSLSPPDVNSLNGNAPDDISSKPNRPGLRKRRRGRKPRFNNRSVRRDIEQLVEDMVTLLNTRSRNTVNEAPASSNGVKTNLFADLLKTLADGCDDDQTFGSQDNLKQVLTYNELPGSPPPPPPSVDLTSSTLPLPEPAIPYSPPSPQPEATDLTNDGAAQSPSAPQDQTPYSNTNLSQCNGTNYDVFANSQPFPDLPKPPNTENQASNTTTDSIQPDQAPPPEIEPPVSDAAPSDSDYSAPAQPSAEEYDISSPESAL
jgi:hypothetical protein